MSRRLGPVLGLLALFAILRIVNGTRCLTMVEEVNPKRVVHLDGRSLDIRFEISKRVTQRLASRIMKIFLVEVLGYPGVAVVEKDDHFNTSLVFERLSETFTYDEQRIIPDTMINMEVWIPPQIDTSPLLDRYHVKEYGSVAPPGHFGWFIPEQLSRPEDDWLLFTKQETATRFDVDDTILRDIKNHTTNPGTGAHYCNEAFCENGMYIPKQCGNYRHKSQPCALLLAAYSDQTGFVKDHIDEMMLYVRVAWVGPNLRKLSQSIIKEYSNHHATNSLVILHWTPSEIIPNETEFVPIAFPRCGTKGSRVGCQYDTNRLVKLAWARLENIGKFAHEAIHRAKFTYEMYEDLVSRYNRLSATRQEEEIACDWLKDNLNHTLNEWMPNNADKNTLIVGGIFPMTGTSYTAKSIVTAAKMAKEAINLNNTILRDYNLTLLANDGRCKSDMVMKSFIDYIFHNYYEKLIGVLGPACSETVEPLVGVSSHYKTVVISYSAEGSTFNDRTKYPYFFRTIGENKQYKHVYLQLLQKLKWHRVAALTEDGQRYTEYISHMQDLLQANGITFVANTKFPRDPEIEVMTRYLQDLKQKRARIIIADVYDEVARQVMCEAYKLEMTAAKGYVWFLPLWLLPRWYDTDAYNEQGEQIPCTTAQMMEAINGYFGLSHASFGPDNATMQEGITVRQWRDRYEANCKLLKQPTSNYAGYAYDAMWTYAYAMDQLIKENQSYVFSLHSDQTVNRLTDIISKTDFHGVSGWIKFVGGPSRFSVIEIVQHIDNETRVVGNFHPNISEEKNEIIDGRLDLNMSAFVWLSKEMPDDGSEPAQRCVLAGLAELLDVSCEVAIVIANIIGFGFLGLFLIVGFIIVKRKYDQKVRLHEKYMKSLGIDLLQSDASGLDKWEIPRDRVVINRKLGEGAFGTVYGGEAFFPEKGWLAVAVKTLKVGSSTEEKLDFLSEVEVMKRFEHKNIIKLLGVCIKCEPVYTVMEFMLYGDLKTYLLARRHLVNDRNYEDSDEISSKKLTAMALDVARALSYLAQLKYVHRDVASRNCLVNAQRIVKLGDFGMTRPMYENDYYKFNRKGMLPVRWMAPESLGLGIFTPASDVWSYGVLLYETITFGSFPFQGLSNNQVLEHVKAGNTLTIPTGLKPQLEGLIRSCWTIDHTLRPKAPEIVDFLATNPRLLSPYLDVPLASVQLEHTGQIEMQLPEKFRKFSVSLSVSGSQLSPGLTSLDSTIQPFVAVEQDEESHNQDCLLNVQDGSEPDSSRPLLSSPAPRSRYIHLQQGPKSQNDAELNLARYVNLQPGSGIVSNDSELRSSAGNIQMEQRSALLPDGHDPNQVSFL